MNPMSMPEIVDELPNFCGAKGEAEDAIRGRPPRLFSGTDSRLDRSRAVFAVALHMHQPLIPAGGSALPAARVISNLEYMLRDPSGGDHYNATMFLECSAHAKTQIDQ